MKSPFEPGQVWTYKVRAGDEASRAIVLQVDEATPVGAVVHFCLTKLRGLAVSGSGDPGDIGFLPLKLAIATQCVIALESHVTELPHAEDFAEAYAEWLPALHDGEAGAWEIPLAEVVSTVASGRSASN